MRTIEKIRNLLATQYPDRSFVERKNCIEVAPTHELGFTVLFNDCSTEWIVACEGWHEHFTNEDEAFACFAVAISDQCRLKVSSRGEKAHKWTMEVQDGAEWIATSTTGFVFYPFWKQQRIEYRSNALLKAS